MEKMVVILFGSLNE